MREPITELAPPKLLSALRGYNLLPAIIFLPTRRKCDEAAELVAADKSQPANAEKQAQREAIFEEFAVRFPEINRHKHRRTIVRAGVAAHHAGHIPAWKLLIEKMMANGLLNALFATSTVAAGVDFPARTVVISNADTRGSDGWRPLRASELQQMTGRAGRRGKDKVGFAVLAPGQFQNPRKIAELLQSPPDEMQSKFRSTYTSLLNLLDAFGSFAQVREIAEKSFAFRETSHQIDELEKLRTKVSDRIREKIKNSGYELTFADVRGFERLTSVRQRLQEIKPSPRDDLRREWLKQNVVSGRIISRGRSGKRFFMVLTVNGEKITAMQDDGKGTSFALSHVNRVYENVYSLTDAAIEKAFFDVLEDKNLPLKEPKTKQNNDAHDNTLDIINSRIESFAGENTSEDKKRGIMQFLWEIWNDAEYLEKSDRDLEYLRNDIWLPFENRAKVLHHFEYLDFAAEKVTERGKWLADLRVDRPLLVGEALRHQTFEDLAPPVAAGLMAAVAADSDRNYGELYLSDNLLDTLSEFEKIIFDVAGVEWKNSLQPVEEINYSAAAAAESWTDGMSWDDLVFYTKAEEGDLVRLLSRTAEALMQIAHLKDSNGKSAAIARQTAEIILREPIG